MDESVTKLRLILHADEQVLISMMKLYLIVRIYKLQHILIRTIYDFIWILSSVVIPNIKTKLKMKHNSTLRGKPNLKLT